jgi:hypothetical protein
MLHMFVTELVSQPPMGWLKSLASYSATRDGWPCDVSVDAWREGGMDDEETTTAIQQAARNTYSEHANHVRHRARVPVTDGLVERLGSLQCNEGRAAVWSERRSRSEGIGDGRRRRHSGARTATRVMEGHVPRTN